MPIELDSNVKRPYYQKDFKEKKVNCVSDQDTIYNFSFSTTGELGDRKAYISTGYNNDEKYTNHYVINKHELRLIHNAIYDILKEIEDDGICYTKLQYYRSTIKNYIDMGYIKHLEVKIEKCTLPNGFNSSLYTPLKIRPIFIDTEIKESVTDFSYIEFVHLAPDNNTYNKLMNYLKMDTDVEIKMIGYDREKELRKYLENIKKELNDCTKRSVPSKEDMERARDILEKMRS